MIVAFVDVRLGRDRPALVVAALLVASTLLRLPSLERRLRVAIDWTLELFLGHEVIRINMRRTRTRPGEPIGEVEGDPVSVGARRDATYEIVV